MIGSYARILSHSHDAQEYEKVSLRPVTIGANARIATHAILLAGSNVRDGETVGMFPGEQV